MVLHLMKKRTLYISCYAPNAIYKLATDGSFEQLVNDWEAHIVEPDKYRFWWQRL